MKKFLHKHFSIFIMLLLILSGSVIIFPLELVTAGSYDGYDLATAILSDLSVLVSSNYSDRDNQGCRQRTVLSSLGTLVPTNGSTFALLSTGMAGADPVTTDALNPGSERGTWFKNKYGQPRDEAILTLILEVPDGMHYLYYDVQFLSAEYPEYVGSQYNDELTVTVDSPSKGISEYNINVNSGDFILDSIDIPGTGFDIFAQSGNPMLVDWVDTTPRIPGADAGATALVTREHPVSPHEQVTIIFNIKDIGDSQFDSAAFIDNLMFSGYAKTKIITRKTVEDLNGEIPEPGDILEYSITISNIGDADQSDNPDNEFEDFIPDNTTYVPGFASASSGLITYDGGENKITWNGAIAAESSIALSFRVTVNPALPNGVEISNQGTVYWDSNENGTNDATELTDDPTVDDGIDQDGDGETEDDDPTIVVVSSYEPPSTLTEDFSDDTPGGNATQTYYKYMWFKTTDAIVGSNFEVASSYHYSTVRSFKTKLRSSGSPQHWEYNLSAFNMEIEWWEVWFACGNASEASDLFLEFKDDNGNDVAKIKFEYDQKGTDPLTDYVIKLYYWSPFNGWNRLYSDYSWGYLYNGWYKLRIESIDPDDINYSLFRTGKGLVDYTIDGQLSSPFSNLESIEWSNTCLLYTSPSPRD